MAHLVNESTGKKYEILDFDKATNTVTLKGPNAVFSEKFDKELFKKLGYKLQKDEAHAE